MNYLILVNKENKMKESYLRNMNFSTYKNIFDESIKVEDEIYTKYLK